MTAMKLTEIREAATKAGVLNVGERAGRMTGKAGLSVIGALALAGCINVAAPDEPIVIELNINIRQEVIYRLAEDAANTIDENADIF
ncbi:YnbE family lipoprotein [Erythrobacter sp.]|nr:YnbE family lipoprotein [Erythrobacter sp.]